MRAALADELEEFIRLGQLWDDQECSALITRLLTESDQTGDPLPGRLGRFLEAVLIRSRMGHLTTALICDVEAIVYPRVWKFVEAVRDGMPDGELRIRLEVMNRRLSRLFAEETA